ncbi:hypothetical protein GCM10009839_63100 [Catenulispora yoronensis]|uniref:HTH merR-type domain-containing protein n=1 Tax=Catenulispora yoronensis TaxID=450799 RepID=A0ABN2V1L5_9ACTN
MNGEPARWTIDRLARLTAAALASGAPAAQPNGRIREVPDVRTIRYYTSIGLLDRPAAMRGRTALYGRRHLAQLVAIKRLQAAGLTLTEVQERLLGTDAAAVERIALLPVDGDLDAMEAFFTQNELEVLDRLDDERTTGQADDAGTDADITDTTDADGFTEPRRRFWSARPATASAGHDEEAAAEEDLSWQLPAVPSLLSGVRLAPDVTLLLTARPGPGPDAADLAAIAEAARPLLDLLHRLGLSES